MKIRLVHWNASEAFPRVKALRAACHEVVTDKQPCDVLVVDLSRLPSRGREMATEFRAAKATRRIPIVFVEGAAEKVEAIKSFYPTPFTLPGPVWDRRSRQCRPSKIRKCRCG